MKIKDKLDAKIGIKARKILDQVAHFLWAFLALAPVLMIESHITGAMVTAVLFALPRELIDQWPIKHWKDTVLDLSFFAFGGAAIGAFINAV